VLVQDAKVELVRPPIAVGGAGACELTVVKGALGFGGHGFLKGLELFDTNGEPRGLRTFLIKSQLAIARNKKIPRVFRVGVFF
jgi:hypothetical protein